MEKYDELDKLIDELDINNEKLLKELFFKLGETFVVFFFHKRKKVK